MALGKDSYWQIEKEAGGYGIHQPARCKSELISEGLESNVDEIPDPSLHAARSLRAIYPGGTTFRGPLAVRLNYEGAILKLLEGVMWSGSSALVGGETYVRDHTIKEGATQPSYSLEMCKGNTPAGKVLRGLGATVASLVLQGGVGTESMGRAEAQLMGTDLDPNTGATPAGYDPTTSFTVTSCTTTSGSPVVTTTGDFLTSGVKVGMGVTGTGVPAGTKVLRITSATSLTLGDSAGATVNATASGTVTLTFTLDFPYIWPLLAKQAITVNNGVDSASYPGGALRVRSWKVTITNTLAERLYLGSANPDQPSPNDFLSVMWEMTEEYQSLKAYQAARLFTDTAPKLIFEDPTTVGAVPSKRQFELRSNKCKAKYSLPVPGYGMLLATVTHKAYYDTVDASALVARVRNLDGSI